MLWLWLWLWLWLSQNQIPPPHLPALVKGKAKGWRHYRPPAPALAPAPLVEAKEHCRL